MQSFFEEQEEVVPIYLQASQTDQLEAAINVIGTPHNYGPTPEERREKKLVEEQIEREKQAEEAAKILENQQQSQREKEIRDAEWSARVAKLEQEEKQLLELQSAPFRAYLMQNVMPTLTKGLTEVCKIRPKDPIDYLAEYLFKMSEVTNR